MVGRWSGTCRTFGFNTGPDSTRCMPPGYTLEFHLDAEFFANASGLQWDHPTSVILPDGTVIMRPEQLYPPGLLRSVTLSPLQDLTNAVTACATLDLGFAQPKVCEGREEREGGPERCLLTVSSRDVALPHSNMHTLSVYCRFCTAWPATLGPSLASLSKP